MGKKEIEMLARAQSSKLTEDDLRYLWANFCKQLNDSVVVVLQEACAPSTRITRQAAAAARAGAPPRAPSCKKRRQEEDPLLNFGESCADHLVVVADSPGWKVLVSFSSEDAKDFDDIDLVINVNSGKVRKRGAVEKSKRAVQFKEPLTSQVATELAAKQFTTATQFAVAFGSILKVVRNFIKDYYKSAAAQTDTTAHTDAAAQPDKQPPRVRIVCHSGLNRSPRIAFLVAQVLSNGTDMSEVWDKFRGARFSGERTDESLWFEGTIFSAIGVANGSKLKGVREELKAVREELKAVREALPEGLEARLAALREALPEGLEARLAALEKAAAAPKSTSPVAAPAAPAEEH